jgi:hypothetical protein
LLEACIMSIATKTSASPLESHDAPRATPPASPEGAVRERVSEPEPLDAVLDNPYDNMACTD